MAYADIVSHWFAERIATGELSRDAEASVQAEAAKAGLIARLEGADGQDDAAIVEAWFRAEIATGAIGRNTAAYNQAFQARAELVARLAAAPPPQIEPAATAPEPEAEPAAEPDPETPEGTQP